MTDINKGVSDKIAKAQIKCDTTVGEFLYTVLTRSITMVYDLMSWHIE